MLLLDAPFARELELQSFFTAFFPLKIAMIVEALPPRGAAPAKALLDLPRGLCAVKGPVALFLVVASVGKFLLGENI